MADTKDKSREPNPERMRRANRAKQLHEALKTLGLRVADVAREVGVRPEVIRNLAKRGSHDETLAKVSAYVEAIARERIGRIVPSGSRARQPGSEADR